MSYTIKSAITAIQIAEKANVNECPGWENVQQRAMGLAKTAEALLMGHTPEEIREYLDITRSILNDLENRMNEVESILDVATKQEEPAPEVTTQVETKVAEAKPKASRVKRSKKVDTMVETVKGKRDLDAGTKAKIDEMKAQDVKPAKVAQEKRQPKAEKATTKTKQPARKHEGMSYAQVRSEVSARKAKLNKADVERMSKAGLKNNTWDGAVASLEWLNRYFPTK